MHQMHRRAATSNETQDQVRLARASVNCKSDAEITKSRGMKRPAVTCVARLGLCASRCDATGTKIFE
jgi:hypothetical protein